jgi:regulator of RNase E activity RraB
MVLSGRPRALKYADKILKKETIRQIRSTKTLKRFGMKILDTLAHNQPIELMELETQGGRDAIIAKVLDEQRLWMEVLKRNASELSAGLIPYEIEYMGWADFFEFEEVEKDIPWSLRKAHKVMVEVNSILSRHLDEDD